MKTHLLRRRLDIVAVDRRSRLRNRARKPPKPLGQRPQRILLEIIQPRQRGVPCSRPPSHLRRRRAPKARILAALTRRQIRRPTRIARAQFGKVPLINLDLAPHRRCLPPLPAQRRVPYRGRRRRRRTSRHRPLLPRDILPPLHLGTQPLLPLLAHLPAIPLGNRRVLPPDPTHLGIGVALKEFAPARVAAEAHALNLGLLEGVHGDGADKRDVHAEAAVDAGAREADEDAELGRGPLRVGRAAVAAEVVVGFLLDRGEL